MIEALRANEPKLKIGWALMRVSTKDQALVQHGSLEQQRHMLERWSTQQTEVTGQTYEITRFFEEDISGRGKSLHKRLALVEIERAIDAKAIDFLVFEKVDRLARDMIYNLGLVKKANANGIEVHEFESGKIDLRDRGSRLGFNIKNLLAEEYSLELEEKITKKQREARVNNGKDTSTMPVLGLDPHPGKRCMYVINQKEQKIVEKIFEYFLKSGSILETANWANENGFRTKIRWTKESVDTNGNIIKPKEIGGEKFDSKRIRYLLSNQKLRGHAKFKDSWNQFPKMQDAEGFVSWDYAHGPVISPELFQKIEDLLATHSLKDTRQREHFYFLSGILFHEDGTRYQGTPVTAKNIHYYYCPKHKQRIRKDMLENLIFNRIKEYLEKGDLLPKLIATAQTHQSAGLPFIQEEISEIQNKIKECNKVIEGFSTMLRKSVLLGGDNAETIIRTLTEEKESAQKEVLLLQRQLDMLEFKKKSFLDEKRGPALAQKIKAVLKTLDQKPDIEKMQILQSIVKKVVVYGKSKIEVILVGNSM
jgi:DNA invertase Pin-like site-specific DNA recombinase